MMLLYVIIFLAIAVTVIGDFVINVAFVIAVARQGRVSAWEIISAWETNDEWLQI